MGGTLLSILVSSAITQVATKLRISHLAPIFPIEPTTIFSTVTEKATSPRSLTSRVMEKSHIKNRQNGIDGCMESVRACTVELRSEQNDMTIVIRLARRIFTSSTHSGTTTDVDCSSAIAISPSPMNIANRTRDAVMRKAVNPGPNGTSYSVAFELEKFPYTSSIPILLMPATTLAAMLILTQSPFHGLFCFCTVLLVFTSSFFCLGVVFWDVLF